MFSHICTSNKYIGPPLLILSHFLIGSVLGAERGCDLLALPQDSCETWWSLHLHARLRSASSTREMGWRWEGGWTPGKGAHEDTELCAVSSVPGEKAVVPVAPTQVFCQTRQGTGK